MTAKVVLSEIARKQAARIDEWWRDSAPTEGLKEPSFARSSRASRGAVQTLFENGRHGLGEGLGNQR